jgi:glycosyltransferase involved in cell wall biosynthesis
MPTPKISVLMPVHQCERYVEDACNSILNQSFADFEFIVLNDGSTDRSAEILEAIARRDQRVILIQRENRGLIKTRNELMAVARAPLIAWMDSDDLSHSHRLARQFERFQQSADLVCLGSHVLEIDPEGLPLGFDRFPPTHGQIMEGMKSGGAMRFPTTMMKTEMARKVGGFRAPFQMGEDFDLFLRLSEVGRLENLQEVLLDYRQHTTNTSRRLRHRWPTYRQTILRLAEERKTGKDRLQLGLPLELQFPPPPPAADLEWVARIEWAYQALRSGHIGTARKHALQAARKHPFSPRTWKLLLRVALAAARQR